jgi:hypothetical protein
MKSTRWTPFVEKRKSLPISDPSFDIRGGCDRNEEQPDQDVHRRGGGGVNYFVLRVVLNLAPTWHPPGTPSEASDRQISPP